MTRNEKSLHQRLLHGFGASALNPIVSAIVQLGSVPVLLHVWGVAKYGDWLLLSALPSYLTLSNLGLGDSSGSDMSMRVAAGDREGALRTFQSSWILVTGVSLIALVAMVSLAWRIPWHPWIGVSTVSSSQAASIIVVLGIYVLLAQQNGIAESGYRSDGHFAMGTCLIAVLRLVEIVAATVVAALGGDLLAAALAYLVVRAVGVVGYIWILRCLSPWVRYGVDKARVETIRELAVPAFGFMAFPAGYALSLQGFIVVIGSRLGPAAAVSFVTLRTLSRVSLQLINVVKHGLWPELSRAFGGGDISLARRMHRRACQASLGMSALAAVALWALGPFIYRLWVRHAVGFDAACFAILLGVGIANSLWEASSVIPESVNSHCRIALLYSVLMLLSLSLAWELMPVWGVAGAALSLLAGDVLMVLLVLRTSLAHVDDDLQGFLRALCQPPKSTQVLPTLSGL